MATGSNQRKLELKDLPILRELGQGYSGYLYETQCGGGKCARKDFPLGSVKRNKLFETEVQPLLDLDHPNIVKCLGYTLGKSSCSLIQEYIDSNIQNTTESRIEEWRKKSSGSTSTSSRLLDGDENNRLVPSRSKTKTATTDEGSSRCPRPTPFEGPEALSIILEIAKGMKHLHENQVVHGDLKPRNVLYSESGERKVKLADFGLSETKKRITLVSERSRHLETVTWKAPERLTELLDDEEVDGVTKSEAESDRKVEIVKNFLRSKLAMADVYSFGLTCSYILCGKVMDSGMSLTKLKKRRMRDSRPKLPSACPENLKSIIVSCLKLDPSSRPTFTTICAALQSDVTSPTEATEGMCWSEVGAIDSSALEEYEKSSIKARTTYASHFTPLGKSAHWNTGREGLVEEAEQVDVARRLDENEYLEEKYFDKPLDEVARSAIRRLGEPQTQLVLAGFDELIRCTRAGGKLQVFRENAIPVAIKLAKTENQYIKPAMTLLEALTSSDVGEENVPGTEKTHMILTTSNDLEFFIKLMKDMDHPEGRLLAAKVVVNMLVNYEVWKTARIQQDIVSALLSISSSQAGSEVCLLGLSHLAKFSSMRIELPSNLFAGYKSTIIQSVLSLLSIGLKDKLLENLAKDTFVALDMEDEVSTPVEEKLRELMETKALYRHSTVLGRMAFISLMTKLCKRNQVCITEDLILYLLVMIRKTGEEMRSGLVLEDLKKLQRLAVELFFDCVRHERDKAQFVLTENESERRTLEGMLETKESGIQDESRLEILEILETAVLGSSRTRITVALLVEMATSESAQCRAKVASTLLKFAQENKPEMQDEAAIDTLVALLEDENVNTRADALITLDSLSRFKPIQTEKLSSQMLWAFLRPECERDIKEAATRLFGLVNRNARSVKVGLGGPDSRKGVPHRLESGPTNPSNQFDAYGLLKSATEEDDSVRLQLGSAGLDILIKYVVCFGTEEHKSLLTTLLYLLCTNGNEEDVIKAEGHVFLVSSLGDNKSSEAAVRGLWILLCNPASEDLVLGAGFVGAAMRCINSNFACSEMALGLAQISLSSEALNEMALALAKVSSSSERLLEIVKCENSEGALLNLLEHCSSLEGKAAAAAVIAKLYLKLAKFEDRSRRWMLSHASSLLFECLGETDLSQSKEFLKALAVVAAGGMGMDSIHIDRGVQYLIQHFESEVSDTEVRRLVLQIFAEMSIVFISKTSGPTMTSTLLKDTLKRNEIDKRLWSLSLMKDNSESSINLYKIIRNYSQAGEGADAAVSVLLEVLQDYSLRGNVPEVYELALEALAKSVEDADRRKSFIASHGIKTVADVMKLTPLTDSVLCCCIEILARVIEESRSKRDTCRAILNCKVLTPLKDAMFQSKDPKVEWQSVVLVFLVVLHGPSSVYTAIHNEGVLHAVIDSLRTVPDCKKVSTELLKCLRRGDRNCRNFIDRELLKLGLTL